MTELKPGGKEAKANADKLLGELYEISNPAADQKAAQRVRPPRIPMSQVRQRLQVPDIPGYYLYWFKDDNIDGALAAYYEFVKRGEISTNQVGIGSSYSDSGNTDLGTNVSIIAGQNAAGSPVRLTLMKLKMEYHLEDKKAADEMNMGIMAAIFGEEARMFDQQGNMKSADPLTYRKTALFNRPTRKAVRGKR